jgi:adenylylsulfate kinase-like enzyme
MTGQDGVMLLVVTGPIASGKSSLARAVACELGKRGQKAAAIDLDLIYEMLDPARAPKTDVARWAQARRMSAGLAAALLAEDVAVVVDGEFLTPAERTDFVDALPPGVEARFVMLSVSFEVALERATNDETRGLSRDPAFLRHYYVANAHALRDVPRADLVVDTDATEIGEAACTVADWAFLR